MYGAMIGSFVKSCVHMGLYCQYRELSKMRETIYLVRFDSSVADHHKRCKQIREEVVAAGYKPKKMFVFLLNTAQFEFLLKEVCALHTVGILVVCCCLQARHTLCFLFTILSHIYCIYSLQSSEQFVVVVAIVNI